MFDIGSMRADGEEEEKPYTFAHLVLANRAYERQGGILGLMKLAGAARSRFHQYKVEFEEALEKFKAERGNMSPERAARENLKLNAILKRKAYARREHKRYTKLIAIENDFLALFGAEVKKLPEEDHNQRKKRTRLNIGRYFPDDMEIVVLGFDGKQSERNEDNFETEDYVLVPKAEEVIIDLMKSVQPQPAPHRQEADDDSDDHVVEPDRDTLRLMTQNEDDIDEDGLHIPIEDEQDADQPHVK